MDAQEQNRTSQATRLSQDVPENGNTIIHHEHRLEHGQPQDSHGLPRESGFIARAPASAIPFPTPSIDPAPSEGLIQEPSISAQQDQSGRFSQSSQHARETVQDPGTSRYSQGSQRHQSRHEPDTVLEPGHTATDGQPHRSLYPGDSEDRILRDSVDAQEQLPPESQLRSSYEGRTSVSIRAEARPRSSRAFQKTRAVDETVMDSGPSKRSSHQRSRSHIEAMNSDVTTREEAIRQLEEQKKETHNLRKALRLAVGRVDAENQRVLALERDNLQALERFSTLNESRLAAQREALNAGSELRLYQFQLDNAHKEIAKAQEMLRTLEKQRDEAEEAASHARATARKHAQEQMIAAAQQEGRRLGFEAGLKRAQEEAALMNLNHRRVPSSGARRESDSQVTALPADFDFERVISSPVHQSTRRARQRSISREPSPPLESRVQSPTPPGSEVSVEEESQPPHAPEYASEIDRAASPGPPVLRYAVSIPPASVIEQQNSQHQHLSESSQPWVTAHEYHQITGTQPSPENTIQVNIPGGPGTVVTFAPTPLQVNPDKKKSWFHRTLTRPWRKASRVVPEAPLSWYQPASSQNPPPIIRVHDFGAPAPELRASPSDNASVSDVSTHLSQFEIVSPSPGTYLNPTESERSLARSGPQGRGQYTERTPLQVIDEDSLDLNETFLPLRRNITPISPSMGRIQEMFGDTTSNYSDPQAVEDWRRSSASVSIATEKDPKRPVKPSNVVSGQTGPPRRRPVHLTVPAPLAPQNPKPPSSLIPGSSSQNSAFRGASDVRPSLQRNPTSATVYGITVEPPSCSPTEAPDSARPLQENLLSPNLVDVPSLRSMTPSSQNAGTSSARNSTAPLTFSTPHPVSTTSHSQAPPAPSKTPKGPTSSRSLAQADRPPSQYQRPVNHLHRTSAASHATRNTPLPTTDNVSIQSGSRSVNIGRNTPVPVNPHSTSHRRTVSDSTYLTPNGRMPGGNGTANEVHGLHRIASNQSISSMRSANSRYSRFDPSSYVEPTALYEPVSVRTNGQGERQRTTSNATGTTLSYMSQP
ncbi:hypothetical protein H2248_004298 [Termitomyces sp. 'cryptogamus']|nr:hypothetical protein H2248_004298 [Termitomyces sp. 'cryptogamus']